MSSNNQGLTTGHSHGLHDVKMRVSSDTLSRIGFIRDQLDCKNNVDAVARSIKLVYNILREMSEGTRIEFHRDSGVVEELKIK
jgi:hypothetical protein